MAYKDQAALVFGFFQVRPHDHTSPTACDLTRISLACISLYLPLSPSPTLI